VRLLPGDDTHLSAPFWGELFLSFWLARLPLFFCRDYELRFVALLALAFLSCWLNNVCGFLSLVNMYNFTVVIVYQAIVFVRY
jgi:hypothetical protein